MNRPDQPCQIHCYLDGVCILCSRMVYDNGEMADPVIRDEQGRFPPGVSGNPSGRPKDLIRHTMREYMRESPEKVRDLVERFYAMALDGDTRAMVAFIENHDGKLPTPLTGVPDGDPIALIIERAAPEPEAG